MLSAMSTTRVRNPPLRDAVGVYAAQALELLDEYVAAGGAAPHVEEDSWVRKGAVFARERRAVPVWPALVRDLRDSLGKRAAHREALAALKADPVIAPQLDSMVGVGLHRRRIAAQDVLEGLVVRLADDLGDGLRLDQVTFARAYASIEEAFHSADIPFEAVAPLRHFRTEAAPVFLSEEVRIDELGDAEVVEFIRAGQVEVVEGVALDPPRYAVKVAYRVPKVLPEGPVASGPAAAQAEAEDRVQEVLRAMAVFRGGRLGRGAALHRSPQWFLRGVVQVGPAPRPAPWGASYALSKQEAHQLPRFWSVLQSAPVRQRKSLAVAMRRFHAACLRSHAEDRLIDLLVCAEALSLNVAADSSDRAEMLHRLALRAGSSLGEHRARREFDRAIRSAYLVRDDVVHGSAPRLPPMPDGSLPTLPGYIDGTEALLREALQRAVALAAQPGEDHAKPDWERIAAAVRTAARA